MPTPKRPPAPKAPKFPKLRLAPLRAGKSVDLDDRRTRTGLPLPPFVRFDHFMDWWKWKQGEHITTIGPTGSGKTVLNRELLRRRDFVVVLGIKNRDVELYGPFQREGYVLTDEFEPEQPDEAREARILYVPKTSEHGVEARQAKTVKFRSVINEVQDVGYWCLYADDIQYMSDQLKLAPDFEEVWMLGRSEGVSMVASSQEPVNIPVMAYGMASHLFLFANRDFKRAERMGELAGGNREIVRETVMGLPDHEFLYINKGTGDMCRSMVLRSTGPQTEAQAA